MPSFRSNKSSKSTQPPKKAPPPAAYNATSQKIQHQQQHNLHLHRMRHRFTLTNILGDPFALSTISIGTIGWVIALAGSITVATSTSKFPVFTWWGISSEFLVIVGVFWVCATNNVHPYRLALLASLATTTVYTTNSTNNFVYNGTPSSAAASAGYILLSIINILWILYFGTTEEAPLHRLIDSYSVNKPEFSSYDYYYGNLRNTNNPAAGGPQSGMNNTSSAAYQAAALSRNHTNPFSHSAIAASSLGAGGAGPQSQYLQQDPYRDSSAYGSTPGGTNNLLSSQQKPVSQYYQQQQDSLSAPYQQQTFMAAPLGAFENSSQIHHAKAFGASSNPAGASQYRQSTTSTADRTSAGDIIATPTEYPYRVRANYSYIAGDHNELSFKKDEILEVNDISGKWWQARRENGEIGICPSNYVSLLDTGFAPNTFSQIQSSAYGSAAAGDTLSSTMTTTTTTTTGYQNPNL